LTMLSDAVKEKNAADMEVYDVAELLSQSI
jgi:hypothetical protein